MNISDDLRKHDFHFKKKFGQNFISDDHLLQRIVDAAAIGADDVVLEIGPGAATLTAAMAERAKAVVAVEIDSDLYPIITERMQGYSNFELVGGDAMQVDFDALAAKHGAAEYKIVANLPYYITTPIIMRILEGGFHAERLVVMVQKEVADRFCAPAGGKTYGAITVMLNYYGAVSKVFNVPRTMFTPRPDVDSAVVAIKRWSEKPQVAHDERLLRSLVKAAFGQRRKTLNNALKTLGYAKESMDSALAQAQIDAARRGETLTVEEFVRLSNILAELTAEK